MWELWKRRTGVSGEVPEETPTRRARRRRRRRIVLSVVGAVLVVAGVLVYRTASYYADPHSHIRRSFRGLELPSMQLVAEEPHGVAWRLLSSCPRIERYYISQESVEATCVKVEAAMRRWGVRDLDLSGESCDLEGEKDRWVMQGFVRSDAQIFSSRKTQAYRPIEQPHQAVAIITLLDD